eukprot:104428-Amorphochlora_amoeboformis.AAC.1
MYLLPHPLSLIRDCPPIGHRPLDGPNPDNHPNIYCHGRSRRLSGLNNSLFDRLIHPLRSLPSSSCLDHPQAVSCNILCGYSAGQRSS